VVLEARAIGWGASGWNGGRDDVARQAEFQEREARWGLMTARRIVRLDDACSGPD
jgi:hypothetical protein